jgi:hypothetical protein
LRIVLNCLGYGPCVRRVGHALGSVQGARTRRVRHLDVKVRGPAEFNRAEYQQQKHRQDQAQFQHGLAARLLASGRGLPCRPPEALAASIITVPSTIQFHVIAPK